MFPCSVIKTPDELVTRLRRSVIMYKGSPVYVEGVDGMTLQLTQLETGEPLSVKSSDTGFDIGSPLLGYVNTDGGAVYVMRRPIRLYKQGLSTENLTVRGGRGFNERYLKDKSFSNMLLNIYPKLPSVLGAVMYSNPFAPIKSSVRAFHRHLAVDGNKLHYKGREVGIIREDKTFQLNERFTYLGEEIEDLLNDC
jgi:hypothetical protein